MKEARRSWRKHTLSEVKAKLPALIAEVDEREEEVVEERPSCAGPNKLCALEVPLAAYSGLIPEVARDLYRVAERGMRDDDERLLSRVVGMLPSG